jgi:hypothetical protein
MTAVRYPGAWQTVAAAINADPRPVAVLPPDGMRVFPWSGAAPVLDPLPRWVSADVLSTGDLVIGGQTIPGEGKRAREVQRLLLDGADAAALRQAGVGWVVVEGPAPALDLPVVHFDDDLALYRVGGNQPPAAHRGLLIGVHLVWAGAIVVAALGAGVGAVRRRRRGVTP